MSDAFAAGVEPGGLRTAQEIKILICYLLHTVNQPLGRDDLTDIIVGEHMANYFDTEEAIEDLLRLQHLVQSDDRRIATTVTGSEVGESLSVRVPYTVREKCARMALELLKRRRIEQDNTVTVEPLPDGSCEVTCAVRDQGKDLMRVTLLVADEKQAALVRERFLADPALLYRADLAVLTGSADYRRAGTQLVIKL